MPFYKFCKYGPLQIVQMCPRTRIFTWVALKLQVLSHLPANFAWHSDSEWQIFYLPKSVGRWACSFHRFFPIISDKFSNCWFSFLDPRVLSKCSKPAPWHDLWKISILTLICQFFGGLDNKLNGIFSFESLCFVLQDLFVSGQILCSVHKIAKNCQFPLFFWQQR